MQRTRMPRRPPVRHPAAPGLACKGKSNKGLGKNADKPRAPQGHPGGLAQAFTDHGPQPELGMLGKGRYLRNPRRSIKEA